MGAQGDVNPNHWPCQETSTNRVKLEIWGDKGPQFRDGSRCYLPLTASSDNSPFRPGSLSWGTQGPLSPPDVTYLPHTCLSLIPLSGFTRPPGSFFTARKKNDVRQEARWTLSQTLESTSTYRSPSKGRDVSPRMTTGRPCHRLHSHQLEQHHDAVYACSAFEALRRGQANSAGLLVDYDIRDHHHRPAVSRTVRSRGEAMGGG